MQRKVTKIKNGAGIRGKYTITTYKAGTKEVLREQVVENLIMASANNGIGLIAQHLAGITTYPLEIDNASIGTGTTDPSTDDTDLETPVLEDIELASISNTATSVTLNFFITDGELANGSYTEFGLFCGTQLFARSTIEPAFTKASGEDTAINYQINITTS